MPPLVSFKGVTKSFGGKPILDDVSFELGEREILGIIGPSGAGKTTALRTLMGFYSRDGGEILFCGNPVRAVEDVAWQIGFATQDECFYDDLTCEENLRYFGTLYDLSGAEMDTRIPMLLKAVELEGTQGVLASKLSGGMRRRLDIAIALLHKPKVLIMDEPTSGLDPVLRKHVASLIRSIREQGISIIITSHLLEELEHLCDNVIMLFNGKIVAKGPPAEIRKQHFPHSEVHLVTYPGNYDEILRATQAEGANFAVKEKGDHHLLFSTGNPEVLVYSILRVLPGLREHLIDIDIVNPTLDEVFEQIVEGGA